MTKTLLAALVSLIATPSLTASELAVLYTLKAHSGMVYAAAFSPDSAVLATGGLDKKVNVWSVSTGKIVRVLGPLPGRVNCITFSADGKLLAVGGEHRTIKV